MLSPNPVITSPLWPINGDAPPLLAIVQAQAQTIADQEALIDDYQEVLSDAQAPASPIATAIGTGSGANLGVSSAAGTIYIGATVAGTGVPAGTTILAQQSGTPGGNGTYTTSQTTTSVGAALTFTPGATATGTATGTSLAVTAAVGVIEIGATVGGVGVPDGTTIVSQQSGALGGNGTYITSQPTTAAAAALIFIPVVHLTPWPVPRDADTLNAIMVAQTAVIRNQTALLQQYQDLLNVSQTAAPPTGP